MSIAKEVKKKHVDISEILKLIQPGKTYYWSATVKGEPENDRQELFTLCNKR